MEISSFNHVIKDFQHDWLVRTCLNAFNVYLTMVHVIIQDSIVDLAVENDLSPINYVFYPIIITGFDIVVYLSLCL